jgi:hypothetical protein
MSPSPPDFSAKTRRLVESRLDFLVVYGASLATMLSLLVGTQIVSYPSEPWSELLLPILAGVVVCLVPPVIAAFLPSGRRTLQVMFGVGLLPIVGAVAVNGLSVVRALAQ